MSLLDATSVLVLSYNEEPNIGRTLDALSRFRHVTVLDSGSTDGTAAIVARYPNANMVVRPFDSHASQWNFGLSCVDPVSEWVLALDADYVLTPELVDEIAAITPPDDVDGYRISFRYCVFGRRLTGSLYPAVVCLFRRSKCVYRQEGHTQRAAVSGRILALKASILHDDRKSLDRWIGSQKNYARLEVDYLFKKGAAELRRTDRIRLTGWMGPPLVLVYTLLWKGCIFDGWPGWLYVLQRVLAETMIALEVVDRRVRARVGGV